MYLFLLVLSGIPSLVAYWVSTSMYGARKNQKVTLPEKDIEEYSISTSLWSIPMRNIGRNCI
ncbi:uncharacterized protein EV420DRAFT_1519212 [Desarmillaria tabescens]|uniref:Uncharacterized protein n=1 Tax=Armillaria tabescens TaxID=1929756 RepID=A0AA39NDG3_ARMTA|nr:uncharacterized protein EV420DRAFT_1519212 [Desarmillaria tabescens]KAK0463630.1 hypothetical protein EV420DRAFT_1519212 [Desarmillaria tabescens]